MLQEGGFCQDQNIFYNQEGSHLHLTKIMVCQWIYPNTLAADKQDDFNRQAFKGIWDFFLKLHRSTHAGNQRENTPHSDSNSLVD